MPTIFAFALGICASSAAERFKAAKNGLSLLMCASQARRVGVLQRGGDRLQVGRGHPGLAHRVAEELAEQAADLRRLGERRGGEEPRQEATSSDLHRWSTFPFWLRAQAQPQRHECTLRACPANTAQEWTWPGAALLDVQVKPQSFRALSFWWRA
jgi:hypothetical protein